MRCSSLLAGAAYVAISLLPSPALADCFDVFGCTDQNYFRLADIISTGATCDFLYQIRNGIYKAHGYCFHTARAISELGNDGCRTADVNALHLNSFEQANAQTLLQAETQKGCQE